jgi:hypothetical protein
MCPERGEDRGRQDVADWRGESAMTFTPEARA